MKSLFRRKNLKILLDSLQTKTLKKSLGSFDLILLGIGCTIGTGIFVLTGMVAALHSGPAVSISYIIAGIACMFACLAYTEVAAMIPASGSSYTYAYVALGEFFAWIVALTLILEYTVGASTVAAGWSGYLNGILKSGGILIPDYLTKSPLEGGLINLPAALITLFIGLLLIRGTKESMMLNRILVAIKIGIIFLFLAIAVPHVNLEHYSNFMPFGWNGVAVGAAIVFFAFIGFDAVATSAEEVKNPKRDLPIGIVGSLLFSTLIYVVFAAALTAIVNYSELNNAEPVSYALRQIGNNWGSILIATGAIAGMTSVILVLMYGQSRILFAISRDQLLPKLFSKVHKKFETPYLSCIAVTIAVTLTAGFTPIHTMSKLTSLVTLFVFMMASISAIVLRITNPDAKRPFKCPAIFLTATLSILICGYLGYTLIHETWKPFAIWIGSGIIIYFFYGYKKSLLKS